MTKYLMMCAALFALPLMTGCGSGSGMDLQPVTGTVTWNGEPLEEGRIEFRALEGDNRAFSGKIENGEYAVETSTGPMRVSIRASRIVPGKFDESNPGEKTPMGEMYIPARYNSRSELTADVPEGGTTADFELTGE